MTGNALPAATSSKPPLTASPTVKDERQQHNIRNRRMLGTAGFHARSNLLIQAGRHNNLYKGRPDDLIQPGMRKLGEQYLGPPCSTKHLFFLFLFSFFFLRWSNYRKISSPFLVPEKTTMSSSSTFEATALVGCVRRSSSLGQMYSPITMLGREVWEGIVLIPFLNTH
jgi:hypothetical protein